MSEMFWLANIHLAVITIIQKHLEYKIGSYEWINRNTANFSGLIQ